MFEAFKKRTKEKIQREEIRRTGGTPETAGFHSRSYHRQFEGYTEIRTMVPGGKTVLKRIYNGKYYEPELDVYRRITLRLFFVLFYAAGTALFIYTSTRSYACNRALYVAVFQMLAVPMLLWLAYVLLFYVPQAGKLTVGEYHTLHGPLMKASMAAAGCLWGAAAASLICFFLHWGSVGVFDFLCAGGFAVSGTLFYFIHWFETRLSYRVIRGKDEVIEDGVEITCD